jgi:hypothetical protein
MPSVTEDGIHVPDPPAMITCTEPLDRGGLCDAAAEWVALGGHSYELTPVPRCLDHALAARRAGCYIRPISKDEFATGSLDA